MIDYKHLADLWEHTVVANVKCTCSKCREFIELYLTSMIELENNELKHTEYRRLVKER